MPLISVIIPSYNHAHFLSRAVDSVLAVERDDLEIVVVDDGSTDDTAAVAASYGDRIRYVHQQNRGLAGARNTGLREAKGELVFFLDADDEIHGDTLNRLEGVLERAGGEFALVACLPNLVSWSEGESNGRTVELPPPPDPPPGAEIIEVTWHDLVFGSRFPCTVLARRAVFAQDACGEFDEGYGRLGCEDRDMWIRIAARHRIGLLPERLVTLHYHSNNMSSDPSRQLAGMRRLLAKACRSGVVPSWRLGFWGPLRANFHNSASIMYFEAGRPGRALLEALKSLLVYPLPVPHSLSERPFAFRLRRAVAALRACFVRRV